MKRTLFIHTLTFIGALALGGNAWAGPDRPLVDWSGEFTRQGLQQPEERQRSAVKPMKNPCAAESQSEGAKSEKDPSAAVREGKTAQALAADDDVSFFIRLP